MTTRQSIPKICSSILRHIQFQHNNEAKKTIAKGYFKKNVVKPNKDNNKFTISCGTKGCNYFSEHIRKHELLRLFTNHMTATKKHNPIGYRKVTEYIKQNNQKLPVRCLYCNNSYRLTTINECVKGLLFHINNNHNSNPSQKIEEYFTNRVQQNSDNSFTVKCDGENGCYYFRQGTDKADLAKQLKKHCFSTRIHNPIYEEVKKYVETFIAQNQKNNNNKRKTTTEIHNLQKRQKKN